MKNDDSTNHTIFLNETLFMFKAFKIYYDNIIIDMKFNAYFSSQNVFKK